jgi:tetratricopeptide (TPR) repeat protein
MASAATASTSNAPADDAARPARLSKGSLSEGLLPGLLRELYVGRKTGLMSFTRGGERRSVRVVAGHIVHGEANVPDGRLGHTMLRHALVSRDDLARAAGIVSRTGKRLGVALRELGAIDQDRLDDALALHVRETLLEVFSWEQGCYFFEAQPAAAAAQLALKLSTGEMILEAVRHVRDPKVVRYNLGDLDRPLVLSTDPLLRFQRVALSPIDAYLCSRVDGVLTGREVLEITPVAAEQAERSLFGLLCVGMLEWLPAPAGVKAHEGALREEILEAFRGANVHDHYQALGISPEATEDEIKAAYYRQARRFHPDIQHDPALADLGQKISAVFRRLSAAFKVLGDSQRRAEYDSNLAVARLGLGPQAQGGAEPVATNEPFDPVLAARQAEEALQRAEEALEQSRYWDAIVLLRDEAVPQALGKVRQRSRLLLAQCYKKNPKWSKLAEEELRAAIQDDPTDVNALFALGTLYKERRSPARAGAMFREVLALKPRHPAALAELDSLDG